MSYNIQRTSILTISISGTGSKLEKFGNVGSVTIPGVPLTYSIRSYIPIDKLSILIDNTILSNISSLNIDLKNDILWYPSKTINEAIAGTTMYPAAFALQGRTLSGSITQFLTSDNVDSLSDTSTTSQVIIDIYSDLYSLTNSILEFNLPSTVFTRRINIEDLITRSYDFRLNTNSGITSPEYGQVSVTILDRAGSIIMDRFNDNILRRS
jgi:hypothetical protein